VDTVENPNNPAVNKLKTWEEAKTRIKDVLGEPIFNAWISQISCVDDALDKFVLEVPDAFFKDWVGEHYIELIQNILRELTGKTLEVELSVNPKLLNMQSEKRLEKYQTRLQKNAHPNLIPFNPLYIFDTFVVGNSNRFAYAASMAVADSPAKAYNPLFIYGGVGLGKTHLMQAACQSAQKKFPNQNKICYVSSESFTNELIDAITHRTTNNFRQKYRSTDILVIDDIQFIAGKESTQEEFFHTFNALYDNHKQIIISSDRPPKEIPLLEERLISRFGWGLITDIQPPDFELRAAILRKKIEHQPIQISDDIIEFIARTIKNNIRELEGALIRIVAYSQLEEKPLNLDLVKEILKDVIKEGVKTIDIPLIQSKVAEHFGVPLGDLKTNKRQKNIVTPRQIAMFLSRELTNFSLPEIGQSFNGKDHTTVLYSYNKIKKDMAANKTLKNQVNRIIQEIKG